MTGAGTARELTAHSDVSATTVLVIDDDSVVAEFYRRSLLAAGFAVDIAHSGSEGIRAARERAFSAVVLDIRLPDMDGLEVLKAISAERRDARIVIVSGYLTIGVTIDAASLGVHSILEKPVASERLIGAIKAHTFRMPSSVSTKVHLQRPSLPVPLAINCNSVAHRWAIDVLKGCTSTGDSRTLASWAKEAGTSTTMICERCSMLDIKPHDARDLMRALFAMLSGERHGCTPHVLLDIADGRTLKAFRHKAGPSFDSTQDIESLNRFLDSQTFVDPHNFGVTVLRSLLAQHLSGEWLYLDTEDESMTSWHPVRPHGYRIIAR